MSLDTMTRINIARIIKTKIEDISAYTQAGIVNDFFNHYLGDIAPDYQMRDARRSLSAQLSDFLNHIVKEKDDEKLKEVVSFLRSHISTPPSLIRELNRLLSPQDEADADFLFARLFPPQDEADDYAPIQLGHNQPPVDKAIKAVKKAIPDIEAYHPNEEQKQQEKTAILHSVQSGFQALKNNIISQWQLFDLRDALTKAKEFIIGAGNIAKALSAIKDLIKLFL